MAAEYGSGGGRWPQQHARQRRPAADDHHLQHYMEDPDLDVSSIVTEFVPLEDPFVPYFGEEMESELCAPLEASFASSIGEGMFARFRSGYPPNTSTPRFSEERVEVARAQDTSSSPQRLDEALADLMEGCGVRSPLQLVEQASPTARIFLQSPPPPPLSELDDFLHSSSQLMSDGGAARAINCFRKTVPPELSEDSALSFLTHCVRWPMRRPVNTLLQACTTPRVLKAVLKTAMDPPAEMYDPSLKRDSYFRVTMKNTVHSLGQLYQMIRVISLEHRGFVDVNFSPVRGSVAFLGYNGNLPLRMSHPIGSFIQAEEQARTQLNALFSTEITLSRCGDDAREVYVTYFDHMETQPHTGQQTRVTEVNVYHIIHPAPSTPVSASHPPLPHSAPPNCQRGRGVSFPPGPPQQHDFIVNTPIRALKHLQEPTYSLTDFLQLGRSFPQYKW